MDDARMMSCLRSVMIHANLRNQLHMASRWGHSDRAQKDGRNSCCSNSVCQSCNEGRNVYLHKDDWGNCVSINRATDCLKRPLKCVQWGRALQLK